MQAAVAYCLIALVDPHIYVYSGLLQGLRVTTREGSVLNPRFPAPVNTYNPTVHALVDAMFAALDAIVPGAVARRRLRQPLRSFSADATPTARKSYVQYEILAGGAGARASRDGASGITVNQSNAKIAPIEIIESEFPTRLMRFDLIPDFGGAGSSAAAWGMRREYVNLADARFSIRSMKHVIPPHGCAGGHDGRTGDISINPDGAAAQRLPTRYADYPLRAGDMFRLDTPGGGGYGDPRERAPEQVLADVAEGYITPAAAEREYGVAVTNGVLAVEAEQGIALDAAAPSHPRRRT